MVNGGWISVERRYRTIITKNKSIHYFKCSVLGNVRIWCKLLEGILLPVKWVFDDRIRFIRTRVRKLIKSEKRFLHFKKNLYHRKNFKCPFLNQEDVPYRKTKISWKAYFIDFFCKLVKYCIKTLTEMLSFVTLH